MLIVRANAIKLASWLRALSYWLREPQHFWLGVTVVGFALAYSLRRGVTEAEVRYAGMVLQLLGVGTVILGIRETRKLFELPGIVDWTRAWIQRIPVFGGRIVNTTGHAGGGSFAAAGARIQGTVSAGANATIEQRIEALEQDARLVRARVDQVEQEIDRKFRDHEAKLREEQQTRAREDRANKERLVTAQTGGLRISLLGAWFLLVGVVLSSLAPEIGEWFSLLRRN